MTEPTPPLVPSSSPTPVQTMVSTRRSRGDRRDDKGRAHTGSQMCLQVWVNRRQGALSQSVLTALGMDQPGVHVEWVSPLEGERFAEYKDGAFLQALQLKEHAPTLATFWPRGGPVWDGLAKIIRPGRASTGYVLVEAKSYPAEVRGGGCKAKKDSKARALIEASLAETAQWLGLSSRPDTWLRRLYQSANRIAHVYFLREQLGLEAYMVNVCFTGDTHRKNATTSERWAEAHDDFRTELGLSETHAIAPWLVDVVLEAPLRAELAMPLTTSTTQSDSR